VILKKKKERIERENFRESTNSQYVEKNKTKPFFAFPVMEGELNFRWVFNTVAVERKIIKTYCMGLILLAQWFYKIYWFSVIVGFSYMFLSGLPLKQCYVLLGILCSCFFIKIVW